MVLRLDLGLFITRALCYVSVSFEFFFSAKFSSGCIHGESQLLMEGWCWVVHGETFATAFMLRKGGFLPTGKKKVAAANRRGN
ncbi:hypothetical protein VTL71DRAFT_16240 [Oculimacula yallundae]|uniref:Secreted protein n=1 Tax=Oculimacula yallundae TaxID=86028 RepID=A0ABR4CEK8_9HELO